MAILTSEAEFERLYQEFVKRNGGIPTLVSDLYNTPAEYYSAVSSNTLSPSKLAELQARQLQYNRQSALNTISSEIKTNNFKNPYNARSQSSISNLTSIETRVAYPQLSGVSTSLSPLSNPNFGGSVVTATVIYAGIAAATGVDLGKLVLGASVITAGVAMFTSLQNHTNSQVADLPAKMEEIDQLTGLQQSFGEMSSDSCSLFNQLMGILSGSFDGVLDFIDKGINQFKDFMSSTAIGQVFNQIKGAIDGVMSQVLSVVDQITDGISGMIDSIVGQISAALDPIMSQIDSVLGPIKDIMNNIGNLAENLIGSISDMASQIAGEIQGLIDMAADIANRLSSLALAAMMLDPCKLAVLLNTGSPELASAARQLTAPVESAVSSINIPTEIDQRAEPVAVDAAITQAREKANTAPGVPQSPINVLATIYNPFSAYLHDLIGTVNGIFNDTFEIVSGEGGASILNKISSTSPNNNIMSGLNSITGALQGTVGDIANNLSALASGGVLNTRDASTNITSAVTDDANFSSGGVVSQVETTATLPSSGDTTVRRSSPETRSSATVITEKTAEGTVSRLDGPSTQTARAKTQWNNNYRGTYGRIIRDATSVSREITNYLSKATFRNESLKREAELVKEQSQRLRDSVSSWQRTQSNRFTYRSNTQDRDEVQETRILNEYNTTIKTANDVSANRYQREISTIIQSWNSIKSQTILNPTGSGNILG